MKVQTEETGEQIQQILDLLPEEYESKYTASLNAWLDGRYLPDANRDWKSLSRREQAEQYIRWLEEERDGIE